jgi:hypothetical protein
MELINLVNPDFKLQSDGIHRITLDIHENLQIDLGINRVIIHKTQHGWQIDCNSNIKIKQYNSKEVFIENYDS